MSPVFYLSTCRSRSAWVPTDSLRKRVTDKKKEPPSTDTHRLSDGRRQAGKTLQPDNHSGSSFHSLRIFYQTIHTNISSKEKENQRRLIRFTPFLDSDVARPLLDAPVVCRPFYIEAPIVFDLFVQIWIQDRIQWWLKHSGKMRVVLPL